MKLFSSPFFAMILTFGFFVQVANYQATVDRLEIESQLLDEELYNSMRSILQRLHDQHQLNGQLIVEYEEFCR